MATRAIPVLMAAMLAAACVGGTPAASPAEPSSPSPTPATTMATATAAFESMPAPSATPTTRPTPTALPVPPKPSGISLDEEVEPICDTNAPEDMCAIGDSTFTLTWSKPRTTKVEVRVYGVKECYGADAAGTMIDGWCLRQHTALPASAKILLAKAPASKGRVTFRMMPNEHWLGTLDGVPVYAFVLAAYNADGEHSVFAIAARAEYCVVADVACNGVDTGPETYPPGSWMQTVVPDVRVRSRPEVSEDSAKYTPLLPIGTNFEIVRGPEIENGYRWYLVQFAPGILDDGVTRGWVADGSRDGEPWIENVPIDEG